MKIISKEPTNQEKSQNTRAVQPPLKHVEPRKTQTKPHKKKVPAKVVKKQAPVPSRPKEAPTKRTSNSYFHDSYNRFVSLLRFNITFKLSLGYTLRLVALIAFLFIFVYISFSYYLFYNAQTALINHSQVVGELFTITDDFESESIQIVLTTNQLNLYVYDANYSLLSSSDDSTITFQEATALAEYDIMDFPNFPVLYEENTVVASDGALYYYALSNDMSKHTNTLESTFPIGFVLCFVLIISSVRSANKMSHKHLKPIRVMTDQVKDMSGNNLSTRLNLSGTKDELKDLAYTFNKMLDDIQKSYEREKQFVSDASHELRTPIAVIKGYAGMLNRWGKDDPAILDESIQAILGETDNMHSLVESLLFIARNDKGALKMDKTAFNFSDLFTEIVKETRLIDSQHAISETIESNIMIHGSADKLKQALRIFIDNSIKYTPDAGNIKLSLRRSNLHTLIVISDDGIGISKEDLPNIFDRFYRADKSRTKMKENQHGGTGLGLSIAKIIIEQHGGKIHVDSALNEGTTFTLFLPQHDPQ